MPHEPDGLKPSQAIRIAEFPDSMNMNAMMTGRDNIHTPLTQVNRSIQKDSYCVNDVSDNDVRLGKKEI